MTGIPHKRLTERINATLQEYLKTPATERTPAGYSSLVDQLARAAMDYATQFNEERRTQLRAQRKGVGRS